MRYFKTIASISAGIIVLISTGCFHHWSEQEKKDFECKCAQTDTFGNSIVMFKGFDNKEFDSILIREYKDTTLLNSFKIFVWPAQSPSDKEQKIRSGTISRTLKIKYKYTFIVPGQKPYELSDMKMIMWAQWTQTSEGYGCVMGDFSLDGVKFKHEGNLSILKRDSTVGK